jgi:hypothetical protein
METRSFELARYLASLLQCVRRPGSRDAADDWTRLRAPARDRDKVLLTMTHLWLHRIPSGIHPKQLCRHHPHIANRFAQCWGDRARVEALVDELMNDRRGQRRGFSDRVLAEIARLELFHARFLQAAFEPAHALSLRRWPGVRTTSR